MHNGNRNVPRSKFYIYKASRFVERLNHPGTYENILIKTIQLCSALRWLDIFSNEGQCSVNAREEPGSETGVNKKQTWFLP